MNPLRPALGLPIRRLPSTASPSTTERGQGLDRLPDIGVLAALVIYVVLLLSTGS